MRRIIYSLVLLLLISRSASAAYTTATWGTTPVVTEDGTNRLFAVVVFTGDKGEATKQAFYGVSAQDLETQVYAFMAKLNTTQADAPKIIVGQPVPQPATTVVSPPSVEDMFFLDILRLYGLNAAIAAGVFPNTDPNYVDFLKQVQMEFQSSYILDNRWGMH